MNTQWSLLLAVALLTGCSDDDANPHGSADGGAMRVAVPDASLRYDSGQDDSGSSGQVDATQSTCPAVQGIFNPVYTPVDGSCGPIDSSNPVPFDGGLHGVNTIMQHQGNGTITTDIVLKGCNLHMTQSVTDAAGMLQKRIDAPELRIESATRITGRISFTRYDATSTLVCQGNYDAVFRKAVSAVGAAR
jgi:hypothetical protein